MSFLDYKSELTNLKRQYLNFLYLIDDFQKEKILAEVNRIDAKIKVMNSLYIEHLFEEVPFEFYSVESKL